VTGLEPQPELAEAARRTLLALGIAAPDIVAGSLAEGHPAGGPYDVILLNGSVPFVPEGLLAQLHEGGRLAAVVAAGSSGQGKAYLFVKVEGEASGLPHFDAGAPPLPGFGKASRFSF
jgi:protein-L-isoaspartate(D-aspartate) O-methyltransferase